MYTVADGYVDSAEQLIVKSMKNLGIINVHGSKKIKIVDRIRLLDYLLSCDRAFIHQRCKNLADAIENAVWDSMKKEGVDKALLYRCMAHGEKYTGPMPTDGTKALANVVYVEVKKPKGKQSENQIKFQKRCDVVGFDYHVVYSVEGCTTPPCTPPLNEV